MDRTYDGRWKDEGDEPSRQNTTTGVLEFDLREKVLHGAIDKEKGDLY